jgi:hypothetical protein
MIPIDQRDGGDAMTFISTDFGTATYDGRVARTSYKLGQYCMYVGNGMGRRTRGMAVVEPGGYTW